MASWWVYATKKSTPTCRQLCDFIIDMKKDRRHASGRLLADFVAENVSANLSRLPAGLIPAEAVLVPTPGSGLSKPDTVWAARTLCQRLVEHGVGHRTEELVRRIKAVPKSAGNQNRPNVSVHVDSFQVVATPQLADTYTHLVLVDDVVTRGTTLTSAAFRLRAAFPHVTISSFAVARVDSTGEARRPPDPLVEYIVTADHEHCSRQSSLPLSHYTRI